MAAEPKFIPVPSYKAFFLTDYKFWAERQEELTKWCENNRCKHVGMMVEAETDYAYTMFILRWS